ncbi:tannase and feruloyl esterase-domain-containing protein [Aspergillus navahoensis]
MATEIFYGKRPKYSYWNSCSTGGRQGHIMAQRYPAQYDGILAAAPAITWDEFIPSEIWLQIVMKEITIHQHANWMLSPSTQSVPAMSSTGLGTGSFLSQGYANSTFHCAMAGWLGKKGLNKMTKEELKLYVTGSNL